MDFKVVSKLMKTIVLSGTVAAFLCCPVGTGLADTGSFGASETPEGLSEKVGNTPPNIFLITIDALRPDRLGCYGYRKNTSPHIDELAKKGVVFENAFATSDWTGASMASLFISKYPPSHGVKCFHVSTEFDLVGIIIPSDDTPIPSKMPAHSDKVIRQEVLGESHDTLAEVLSEHGYNTAGFSTNDLLYSDTGYAQGFETYMETNWVLAEAINEKVFRFLPELPADKRPFFVWIHYVDPHYPYNMPVTYAELDEPFFTFWKYPKETIVAYDNEIRYTDEQVGLLLNELERLGLMSNTVFVITADHGESFGEHWSEQHAFTLYQEEIRIPLIISSPLPIFPEEKRIDSPASLVDIMPTILDLVGIPVPDVQGRTLLPAIDGSGNGDRDIYAELKCRADIEALIKRVGGDLYKLIVTRERDQTVPATMEQKMRTVKSRLFDLKGPYWEGILEWLYNYRKLSRFRAERDRQLFNLTKDPMETRNLIDSKPEIAERLEHALKGYSMLQPVEARKLERTITAEQAEKLKTLGYLR